MSRSLLRVLFLLGLFLSVAGGGVPHATADSAEERRLHQAREQLEQVREQIDAKAEATDQRRESLAEAEAHVAKVVEAVHAAEMAVQRQEETVRNAQDRYEGLQSEANTRQQAMADRAAELYRQGTGVPMTAVLASDSVDDVLTRSSYLELVQRADRAGFEQIESDQVALDAQREVLEAEEESLQERLAEQEEVLAQARELRDERQLKLAGVEEELTELESQERHLESESRELAAMARRANQVAAARQTEQAQQASSGVVATPSGDSGGAGWRWPASGPVTSEYGMRWGRMHEGIDVGGGRGSAVVAARPGTVKQAGRMGGYGNLVLLDHGQGITTAYAHLSSISVSPGQSVGGGQQVGGMGCTGSCTGTHLHFEVRVNGSPRNPRQFLP